MLSLSVIFFPVPLKGEVAETPSSSELCGRTFDHAVTLGSWKVRRFVE